MFFHNGNELTLRTTVLKGHAWLDEIGLHVEGPESFQIGRSEFQQVKLFRLHGLGRVIQLEHLHGRLFLSVTRLMIGQFAFINFFKTGRLHEELLAFVNRGH
ncbi:MAG: hypothetical protein WBQ94_15865 [Terracidiphilus sp.]